MNKASLRAAIVEQLQRELAQQINAAHVAREEAISEESRAENKYDTHSQEAAYLAEGQARLAAEIESSLALYAALPLPDFAPADPIALGAVVEVSGATSMWYFLGPRGGGMQLALEGREIFVVTPQSPVGRQLMGRRTGETVTTPGRGKPVAQRIVSVR